MLLQRQPSLLPVVFRALLWGGLVALLLAVAALGVAWALARESLPVHDGVRPVAGLGQPVSIVRDPFAVPHVFAASDEDVFFALGYVHAQDRLWQMLVARATIQGRLSERFGRRGLGIDRRMRVLGLHHVAERNLASLPAGAVRTLEAYSRGVNAFLRGLQAEPAGRGAPELFLFSTGRIEAWRPVDSVGMIKLMALRLSGDAQQELEQGRFASLLPAALLRGLYPPYPDPAMLAPGSSPPPAPAAGEGDPAAAGNGSGERRRPTGSGGSAPVGLPGAWSGAGPGGSNAWAAAGSRSTSGRPLLANDPHLGFSAPGIWYLARLRFEDHDVIGATIPGLPVVVLGRNEYLGWGLTSAYVDDQDIVFHEVDATAPNLYRVAGGFAPLRVRREVIRIRGVDEPVIEPVRETRQGPVLPPDLYRVAAAIPEGTIASLRWTAREPEDRSLLAGLRLMRSRNVGEALDAVRHLAAPAQNVMLADAERIALVVAGRVPIRAAGHDTGGRLPAAGWKPVNDWLGYYPGDRLPGAIDPPGGLLANANNRTSDAPFPRHVTHNWASPYRMRRLHDLLQERDYHSLESFARIQADAVSYAASDLLAVLLEQVRFLDVPSPEAHPLRGEALRRLQEWDGAMAASRPEPLIFTAWMQQLTALLLEHWVGPDSGADIPFRPRFLAAVLAGGESPWCDDQATPATETCRLAVLRALDRALAELADSAGDDLGDWRWGRAHAALHRHVPLGFSGPLRELFNIRHEFGGSNFTLARAGSAGEGDEPYAAISGAGYRGIYDLAQPERSRYIIATGQSGHFLSPHYDDLTRIWQEHEYLPMRLPLPREIRRPTGTLRLEPRPADEDG